MFLAALKVLDTEPNRTHFCFVFVFVETLAYIYISNILEIMSYRYTNKMSPDLKTGVSIMWLSGTLPVLWYMIPMWQRVNRSVQYRPWYAPLKLLATRTLSNHNKLTKPDLKTINEHRYATVELATIVTWNLKMSVRNALCLWLLLGTPCWLTFIS